MKKVIYGVLSFAPVLAFAAADLTPIQNLVKQIGTIVLLFIPILFALAIVYFFWGLIVFLRAAGDPKAQEAGRNQMIWGVIALAVILSVYGLIQFLQTSLGVGNQVSAPVPTVLGL